MLASARSVGWRPLWLLLGLLLLVPWLTSAQVLPPAGGGGVTESVCVDQVGIGITADGKLVCTKLTATMTDSTIAKTGVDISASGQVISTHLGSPLPFGQGGHGLNSGAAGGLVYFPTTSTMGSTFTLGADLPLIGGGLNNPPSTGTKTGQGTLFPTAVTPLTADRQLMYDGNGNLVVSAFSPGTPTQAGFVWQVVIETCLIDPNAGKLTLNSAGQIICAADVGGGGASPSPVLPDGGTASLVCGPGQQGKVQVLDNGDLQYCDGATSSQLHSGVPTQAGLTWSVNPSACLADTLNNGKLTVNSSGQIVCGPDTGSGVVASGTGGHVAAYIGTGTTVGESPVLAAQVVTASSAFVGAGRLVQAVGATREVQDSGVTAGQVVTASALFTTGHLLQAGGNDRTALDSGLVATSLCTTSAICTGYQGQVVWGAGLTASGNTAAVASTEAGFLTNGNATALTCGAGQAGKMQVLANGDLQYCDGATTSLLRAGLPTQSGLAWNVSVGTCTGDGNGGKLTINGANQIICAADLGGTGSAGPPLFPDGGTTALVCGPGQQGKVQVLDNGELQYCDGANTAQLHTGVPTQSGVTWNVNPAACLADTTNGGKLTLNSSGQIVCGLDSGSGTVTSGVGGHLSAYIGTGTTVGDSSVTAAQVVTAVAPYVSAGRLVQSAGTARDTSDSGLMAGQVLTAPSAFLLGHVLQAAGNDRTASDSGLIAGQVVTQTAVATGAGHVVQTAGPTREVGDSGILTGSLVTAASVFTSGHLLQAGGNDRTSSDSGILASSLCTTAGICAGYQGSVTWGAGLVAVGNTAAVASTEAGFLTNGGGTPLVCGAGSQGKAQVLANGELQYCDGASTALLRSGLPTQSGLSWAVTAATCTGDAVNGGKLTVNGAGQIVCGVDSGVGTVNPGTAGLLAVYMAGGAVVSPSGVTAAQVVTATSAYSAAGRLVQAAGVGRDTADSGIPSGQVVTAASAYGGAGRLVQAAGANRDTQDSGLVAAQVVTAPGTFNGNLVLGTAGTRALVDTGVSVASLCTTAGICAGYQGQVTWGAGLKATGDTASVDSLEAGFLANGGSTTLTCGAGNAGKAQVLANGEVQYCDGAATPLLRTGLLTQSGLSWNVTAGVCTGDANAGKLTVNGSGQIVCAPDQGGGGGGGSGDISAVGTVAAGDAFTDSTPGQRLSFSLIAPPTTPVAGVLTLYAMATAKNLAAMDDAGVVKHAVRSLAPVANSFVTGLADDGTLSVLQPSVANLSDGTTLLRTNTINTMTGTGGMTGLPVPANPSDAATKSYVDAVASGLLPRGNVRVATVAALTSTYSNGTAGVGATLTNSGTQAALTLDGTTLATADRVLVKNQAAPAQNGVYTVTNTGTVSSNWVLTRATDYDADGEIAGSTYVVSTTGAVNANILWIETTPGPFTVGTTPLTFAAMGIAPQVVTLTGDATGTGIGTVPTTVSQINGVAFTGAVGHLVHFASTTTPGDSGVPAGDVVTAPSPFTAGQVLVANASNRTVATTGIPASLLCTTTGVCTGYQPTVTWGAGLTMAGTTASVASTEAGFLTDGGGTNLTCGAGNQGKAQVMDSGELQYCDGATPAVLRSGLPTQTGLSWNVTIGTCTGDSNGGKLTVNGSGQIVCAADLGGGGSGTGDISAVGTATSGEAFTDTTPGQRLTFAPFVTPSSPPPSGKAIVYVDSLAKTLSTLNDANLWTHTVQSKAPIASQFLTGIADTGVVSAAQPASTDLSDSATLAHGTITPGTTSYGTYYSAATTLGPTSALKLDGVSLLALKPHVTQVINANKTLGDDHTILCNAGALDRTMQLPSAATTTTGYYKVIKSDAGVGACKVTRAGSDLINGATASADAATQWSMVEVALVDSSTPGAWHALSGTASPFTPVSKTAAYQVLASDFAAFSTLTVPNGTFTITLVPNTAQPPPGQFIQVVNYGAGVITLARSGQNINGGTSNLTLAAGSATAPTAAWVVSDGSHYVAWLTGVGGAASGGAAKGTVHLPVAAVKLPIAGMAAIDSSGTNTALLYDGTAPQCALWQFVVPQDYGTVPKVRLEYRMSSGTTGAALMDLTVMDTAPGAAVSIETDSYGASNQCSTGTIPGTPFFPGEALCPLTNTDGLTAGHNAKIKLCRLTTDGADTATGTLGLIGALLEYIKN